MSDWKSQYEDAAEAEHARYLATPLEVLLDNVARGKTGEYYVIWGVLAKRGRSPAIGWALYDFLNSKQPYLDRYHCAVALLQWLGSSAFQAVELSAAWPTRPDNLARLRVLVEAQAGVRAG